MNIKKILEGLNVDRNLINDIDSIINIENYDHITKVIFNENKLTIYFKVTDEIVEDESFIDISFQYKELEKQLVNISLCEYISNYGRVNIEDVRNFNINNKYTFEYDKNDGICGYSCQHALVELLDEPGIEEPARLNQNNYNIFVFNYNNVKSYSNDRFLALLNKNNDEISSLDMILLGRDYFINQANRNDLLFDKEKPLTLRMK